MFTGMLVEPRSIIAMSSTVVFGIRELRLERCDEVAQASLADQRSLSSVDGSSQCQGMTYQLKGRMS